MENRNQTSKNNVRVRLAPSPTGNFHIGTARTALFNYLFARQNGGTFVLRFEDTDRERSTAESEQDILDGLKWLGLTWDGAPERQMDKLPRYKAAADELLAKGLAYRCFCAKEELEAERKEQEANHQPPKYSGRCRNLPPEEAEAKLAAGMPSVTRFKIAGAVQKFTDLIMGEVSEDTALYGDFVILRADGIPLYNLANVVDDHDMNITHVIRGADLLPSTIKQLLLYEALGWAWPEFAHLPLILNENRSKMSKRKDPVSITRDFRDKGYLPEALVNFMVLLGWAPEGNRELFTLDELAKEFSLERVHKGNAVFNPAKLDDINGQYIRALPAEELAEKLKPFLPRPEFASQAADLLQERLVRLDEAAELAGWLWAEEVKASPGLLVPKKSTPTETATLLEKAASVLEGLSDWQPAELETSLRQVVAKAEVGAGNLLWPIRAALTGLPASPGVFEVLSALGKDKSLVRIKAAIKSLRG